MVKRCCGNAGFANPENPRATRRQFSRGEDPHRMQNTEKLIREEVHGETTDPEERDEPRSAGPMSGEQPFTEARLTKYSSLAQRRCFVAEDWRTAHEGQRDRAHGRCPWHHLQDQTVLPVADPGANRRDDDPERSPPASALSYFCGGVELPL
jgi:hypothetical protein